MSSVVLGALYRDPVLALGLLAASAGDAIGGSQDPYLLRFLLSPGAGGIAVFLAAVIAGVVAWRNADKISSDAQTRAADERVRASTE